MSAQATPTPMSKIQKVQTMEGAALSGKWDEFKSYLADDIYYRVGNTTEVRGPQAIVDFMIDMLKNKMSITGISVRGAWETEDTVILEFSMTGVTPSDNKTTAYPCIDVFRFRGDKICDWRVSAIHPVFVK